MPNPGAIYKIRYDGQILPGYVQAEDLPINSRPGLVDVISRDGGIMSQGGTGFRTVNLTFRLLSRLPGTANGQAHLADVLEQYRDAARKITRVESGSTLFFGDTAHWMVAQWSRIGAPMVAPDNKRISYSVEFNTQPWFYGPIITSTDAISGDDTIVLSMTDTRKTYPVFQIPTGITGITVTHTPSGKSFTLSGAHSNAIIVDCANLTILETNGDNAISKLTSGPDFGIYHVGSGSFSVAITGVTGSGDVITSMNPRLER